MTSVLSVTPSSSRAPSRRPISWSVCSPNAAKISICRANTWRSSGVSAFQSLMAAGFGASFVSGGTTPSFFCRASVSSRYWSQPPSKRPSYFLMYDSGTWCGACVAPGAKYMKNGRSGVRPCCCRIQAMAWFVMSVMKW